MVNGDVYNKIHPIVIMSMERVVPTVVPVILTVKPDKFNDYVSKAVSMGYQVGQQMQLFSMLGILVRPEDIPLVASHQDVLFVDADLPKFALSPNPNQQPFTLPPLPPLPPFMPPLPGFPPLPGMMGSQNGVTQEPGKNWIPTSESRKIIGADVAEAEGYTGTGVTIAILDTGVFPLHPQLMLKVSDTNAMLPSAPKLPFFPMPPEPPIGIDDNGHGTHVITTIGGDAYKAPNGMLCKGVAPGAKLISIKVLGTPLGMGRTSDVLKGMEIAIQKGAHIISMSLGSEGGDNSYPEARLVNSHPDHIWCIAAGNSGPGPSTVGNPGCAQGAITVGSYGITDKSVSHFSSRGPTNDNLIKPDVLAPGGGRAISPDKLVGEIDEYIYSGTSFGTVLDIVEDKVADGFTAIMGTSMATPHVSGLLALAIQAGIIKTSANVKDKMSKSAAGKDNIVGWGLITWNRLKTQI